MLWFRAIEASQRLMYRLIGGWEGERRCVVCLNGARQRFAAGFKAMADFGEKGAAAAAAYWGTQTVNVNPQKSQIAKHRPLAYT
jgi:hypothetical protein